MKAYWTSVVAMLCLVVMMPAIAGQLVVIDSRENEYPLGTEFDSGASVTLPAGAKLTLLADDGEIYRLTGPFTGRIAAQGGDAKPTDAPKTGATALIARLLSEDEVSASLLGAMRGDGLGAQPDPDFIMINHDGHRCLFTEQVTFWRPDAEKPLDVILFDDDMRERAKLHWETGIRAATIPDRLLAGTDDIIVYYPKEREGRQPSRVFLFLHRASADRFNHATQAAWLIENRCLDQAVAMIRTLQ